MHKIPFSHKFLNRTQFIVAEEVFADRVPRCTTKHCGGIVKPGEIVWMNLRDGSTDFSRRC